MKARIFDPFPQPSGWFEHIPHRPKVISDSKRWLVWIGWHHGSASAVRKVPRSFASQRVSVRMPSPFDTCKQFRNYLSSFLDISLGLLRYITHESRNAKPCQLYKWIHRAIRMCVIWNYQRNKKILPGSINNRFGKRGQRIQLSGRNQVRKWSLTGSDASLVCMKRHSVF